MHDDASAAPLRQEHQVTQGTPDPPAPVTGRRRSRLRRRLVTGIAGVLVLATAAGAAALWVLTGRLLQPIDDTPLNIRITAATPDTVTLPADDASRAPGVYGLTWQEDGTGQRHSGSSDRSSPRTAEPSPVN
ncbi:hypothetical protein ACFQ0T_01830 [Kitasatospora gansuensis]